MTSAFTYRAGTLCAESVSIEAIAADIGTPFYIYSTDQLKTNYKAFADAVVEFNATVFYAVKGNSNQAVIRTLAECGAGADITSIGELERALAAGTNPNKIVFSGVGKTKDEITAALFAGIHQLNVESIPELYLISHVASELKLTAPIAIRVNPDVDAYTHDHLTTGKTENKFGIEQAQLAEAIKLSTTLPGLSFKGFDVHIGSQLTDFEPFRQAYRSLADLVRVWRSHGIMIERLDLGGGIGVPYSADEKVPPLTAYAAIVRETVGKLGCELGFEPGRVIAATAGLLISRAIHVKKNTGKRFLIVDAGMNDLVRPAMYGARHEIMPIKQSVKNEKVLKWDVVGSLCETGDHFGIDHHLPDLQSGDLIAFQNGGWMGTAMASFYNAKPLAPEVLVSGSDYAVIRRRISVAEQMEWEALPQWMSAKTG